MRPVWEARCKCPSYLVRIGSGEQIEKKKKKNLLGFPLDQVINTFFNLGVQEGVDLIDQNIKTWNHRLKQLYEHDVIVGNYGGLKVTS